jgi:L-ascorbate metabolism protein UlaG (beta-lactamase superfamily)
MRKVVFLIGRVLYAATRGSCRGGREFVKSETERRRPFAPSHRMPRAALLLPLLAGCGLLAPTPVRMNTPPVQTHAWHTTDHHAGKGFRNVHGEPREVAPLQAFRWMASRATRRVTPSRAQTVPLSASDLTDSPRGLRVTWLGHSALVVQTAGRTVLIDPMLGERASPVGFAGPKRLVTAPIQPAALPRVDAVVISHDHYDHLDKTSVRELVRAHDPLFLVPLGVGDIVRDWGATRIAELDWDQYVDLPAADGHPSLRVSCTPARHFSGRSLTNRNGTLWASWYFSWGPDSDERLFYGGDTGYDARLFGEIRARYGAPGVAVLPVGAYLPRWFMEEVHMAPEDAVQSALDLGAEHLIPVHWGVFDLADEPMGEPPVRFLRFALEAGIEKRVHELAIGERWELPD